MWEQARWSSWKCPRRTTSSRRPCRSSRSTSRRQQRSGGRRRRRDGGASADPTFQPMRTRLTDLLEIEHPVMLAGMGGVSYHRLVAAVSDAGGFGCLGASVMGNDEMVAEIRGVRELTDRPFGVDLLTAMPGNLLAQVELLIKEGASVFVAGLGVPREAIELCHSRGVLVANMCGKVAHARAAVEAGCDLVVAQGTEA